MSGLTGGSQAFAIQTLNATSDQKHALGARGYTSDGRRFRYVQAGAADLVAGNVIQAPAQITNHQDMTPAAAAIGATSITVTPGATAGAANLYAGGLAIISTTPGLGQTALVSGHSAISASTAFTFTIDPADALNVALTTSSRVDLQVNPYKNVIQAPITTLTGAVVGVATYAIPATYYGWIQTWGPAGVLIYGTPAVGVSVSVPSGAAGAAAVNSGTLEIIGTMMVTGVDGKVKAVFLTID